MKTLSLSTSEPTSLKGIIRHYRKWRKANPDRWLDHCITQNSLKTAIQTAAKSVDAHGVMSGHQCLVGSIKLGRWADYLSEHQASIRKATSFAELHTTLEAIRDKGKAAGAIECVGELLLYDTAHRLGGYLRLFPQEVYLHNGTRSGAKRLLKHFPRGSKCLKLDLFPKEFLEECISASELEDILCIYKDDFYRCYSSDDLSEE